jgi:hypothetical protein
MRALKGVIATHQSELRNHAFFELIHTTSSPAPLASMAKALAWWPMVFQDVLRLNVQSIQGSGLERLAEFHRDEDSGHERWYLEDLSVLGVEQPALDELFGDEFRPIRDACYALTAEVFRHQSGAERVALLLALEPTGHVFFEEISTAVDRVCPQLPLRYFARTHLGVEKDHDLFAESTNAHLERIVLTDSERASCEAMVSRVYRIFGDVFSYLENRMTHAPQLVSDVRELVSVGLRTRVGGNAQSS